MAVNEDALDRKGAWIERMFDRLYAAVLKNPYATLLVLSVGLNFMQYQEAKTKDENWRKDITALNEKINAAVERGVERETARQIAPIKAQQDSTNRKLDTSLNRLNNTIENVDKKYN